MESGQLWGLVIATQSKQVVAGNGKWNAHEDLVEVHPKNTLGGKRKVYHN